jgi:choline kinase
VVVVGYEQQQIRDHLSDVPGTVAYVVNPLYEKTNTLYSLWLAREYFDDDFVYFNADVLFDYRVVRRLVDAGPTSNLACLKGACGEEEVKVVVKDGRITEIGKHIAGPQAYGEFIGIGLFRRADNARFRAILEICAADESNWGRYFEHAVNILAPEARLHAVDISDLPATEIDFPQDLERARRDVYPRIARGT